MSKNRLSASDLAKIGSNSDVTERRKGSSSKTRSKTLTAVPEQYFDAFDELKKNGNAIGSFNAYILEAVRRRLKEDDAI